MKLSKQERIAAIVVLVLVILVAGVFLFIKPNIETIISTKQTLEAKETEYNNAVARAATKEPLKTQILDAYNQGKNLADMFFPELKSYELDYEFHEFLENCESNILVEDFNVSYPATATLGTSVYVPSEVHYALKDYVNQGGSNEIIDPRLVRQAMIQASLGEAQTIGASVVTFTVYATSVDELLKFADEINNYEKSENGKMIRKAIELGSISVSYPEIKDAYTELITKLQASAGGSSGGTTSTPSEGTTEGTTGGSGNNNENINNKLLSLGCTVTFYSIERMQDPTSTLNEQDAAI